VTYNPSGLGFQSWKNSKYVSAPAAAFISNATVVPAAALQSKLSTNVLLPSVTVKLPSSVSTSGALPHDVALVAALPIFSNVMAPEPEKVYEDVSSWDWRGSRKTRLQVVPA